MEIINKERYNKFKEVISNLKSKNICIIYDTDADGLSSAVLLTRALTKLGTEIKLDIVNLGRFFFTEENKKKLEENNIDFIIFLDTSVEGTGNIVGFNALKEQGISFLIIDHHEYNEKLQSEKALLIHPLDMYGVEPSSFSTVKMVYELFYDQIKEYDWIKCIGMIGDMNFLVYPEEVKSILSKYEGREVIINTNDNYFTTKLGSLVGKVDSAKTTGENEAVRTTYKDYLQSETPEELKEKLEKDPYIKDVHDQISNYVNSFDKIVEKKGDVYFLEIKAKYRINSPVSTITSQQYKDKTIVTYQRMGTFYGISARRQDQRYNMSKLLGTLAKEFKDAVGGGHIPASGGKVRLEDIKKYLKRLLEIHEDCKND